MGIVSSRGSYLTPSFDKARVSDAMRAGAITCTPDTPLVAAARMMATNHIHALVVVNAGEGSWAVLSDLDLVAAGADAEDRDARSASGEAVTVGADETLARAAQLMTEHATAHVVVIDEGGHPAGVLSTLDIAGVIAWGRA